MKKLVSSLSAELAALLLCPSALAQTDYEPYYFGTMAGRRPHGATDGVGSVAEFHYPSGVALDSAGNVYVADRMNHTIRKQRRTLFWPRRHRGG